MWHLVPVAYTTLLSCTVGLTTLWKTPFNSYQSDDPSGIPLLQGFVWRVNFLLNTCFLYAGQLKISPWPPIRITLLEFIIADLPQVVDQYLPDCHTFLGAVFIEVQWHQWVEHIAANLSPQECAKVHSALLHLLIKLANEPNVRQVNNK